jgi:REP element-mobilizing transposase RayT
MTRDSLLTGRVSLPHHAYLVTITTNGRAAHFRDFACGRAVVREMRRLHEENVVGSMAWVLMPDHLHWLFQLGDSMALSEAIRRFKGRSARAVNRHLQRAEAVWQRGFHDHGLRKEEGVQEIARYIVANRCAPDWCAGSAIIPCGTRYGCKGGRRALLGRLQSPAGAR